MNSYKILSEAMNKTNFENKENKDNNDNKTNIKRKNISISIIVAIALIAIFTNPSLEEHKAAVKNKYNDILQKKLNEDDGYLLFFTMMIGGNVLEDLVENAVSRDNYILVSTTKVTFDGETKVTLVVETKM